MHSGSAGSQGLKVHDFSKGLHGKPVGRVLLIFGCRVLLIFGCRVLLIFGCRVLLIFGCRVLLIFGCRVLLIFRFVATEKKSPDLEA